MKFNVGSIQKFRRKSKLTQIQMGALMGINQASYQRRETGLVDLTIHELEELAGIFKVSLSDFFEYTQPMRGEKGTDSVEFWQRKYFKLLGRYELMTELYQKPSLPPGVRDVASTGGTT